MGNDYAPGMRAIIREEEWMIKKVGTNSMGNKALSCVGVSPLVKDREAIFLTDLEDISIVDPAKIALVPDNSPRFIKTRLFLESQWRRMIPTDSRIHVGDRAAMDVMTYQLEPAQTALKQPRQRILIADAVGLGKTLEAGVLMSELIARGKGKRILVVTAKSMMTQFQKEMWNRFTIPLVRLDSREIQRIRATLSSNCNPFFYYDKTIISVDTLKRDVEYRAHLENAYWDIIVIDEAQNVAERGDRQAQRARLAKLLAKRSDTLIMLSATPHDGRARSFASLMLMLDPTAIANPDEYTRDDIKGLCVRRFKKDVKDQMGDSYREALTQIVRCPATQAEERAFDVFTAMELDMDLGKKRGSGQLFKTGLEKALFSSPAACIKSIDERIKKLEKKYVSDDIRDISSLTDLRNALVQISPAEFSRYQELLTLLRSPAYGWRPAAKDDRVVIFTERIETMKYLAEHLRADLGLDKSAVQEVSGSMGDADLQDIVEQFGRTESPIRVLVASDVASEGLNLHYLCHRLIHFDIPWSFMVFQQRNGRIDRYGQNKRPDIRCLFIKSENKRIKGDMRIMELLVEKERQAIDNIGDPAQLLGKFNIEDEEAEFASQIESGADVEAFEKQLDANEADFDMFNLLMGGGEEPAFEPAIHNETLFSDLNYIARTMEYINRTDKHPIERLAAVSGLDIKITPDLRRRLSAVLPVEAQPKTDTLRLTDDKAFMMDQMQRSMQNNMEDTVWPSVQYLWPLHPVFAWADDKNSLLYRRGEAPLIALPGKLATDEYLFIMCGSIPNAKATPLVDQWFGLHFKDGKFVQALPMDKVVQLTGLRRDDLPNTGGVGDKQIDAAAELRGKAVEEARKYLKTFHDRYVEENKTFIDAELDKLAELEKKHRAQLELFREGRAREKEERRVDELFKEFGNWVHDTLEIKQDAYIRIIAVVTGA